MSENVEREPCPRCGEPAPLAGRLCPHCKASLLVDVAVQGTPPDGRTRYQIARGLSALGPPAPAFAAAQQALAIPGSVLVSGVTRDVANRVIEVLEEHGAKARQTAAVAELTATSRPSGGGMSTFLLVLVLLFAVGGGLYAWIRQLNDEDEIDMPTRPGKRAAGPVLSTTDLAARVTPATVVLRCPGSIGSGFVVAKDLILTNAHVLCPGDETLHAVFNGGRDSIATVDRRDDWLDLALVRVQNSNVEPLPLGDATALRTGDHVVLVGTPEGLGFTVHEGIVSHQARSIFGIAFLQIDANVNPGNSGGPLLDLHGRVVGVVSAKVRGAEGLGFALPINYTYSGDSHLLPAPFHPAPDKESWRHLLAEVAAADRKEVQRAENESGRPALLALHAQQGKGLVAVVARRAQNQPASEGVTFTFLNNQRMVCRVNATAQGWRLADQTAGGETESAGETRYVQWMKKNGLEKAVYLGFAPIDLHGCPLEDLRGAQVVLEDGDERSDRISIQPGV